MPGRDGFALLEHAQKIDPDLPVILLTGEGDIPMAVKGMNAGAFDFLEKPCAPQDLLAVVAKALKTRDAGAGEPAPEAATDVGRCRGADAVWHLGQGRGAARPSAARWRGPAPKC